MADFLKSASLLLVLLNPFLVILYLIDLVENLDTKNARELEFEDNVRTLVRIEKISG